LYARSHIHYLLTANQPGAGAGGQCTAFGRHCWRLSGGRANFTLQPWPDLISDWYLTSWASFLLEGWVPDPHLCWCTFIQSAIYCTGRAAQ
jgi:hypothetical protein